MDNSMRVFLPDSDDSRFEEKIVSDTSNEEKSENERQFEFLDIDNSSHSNMRVASLMISQETDTKASWTRSMTKALLEEYTIMLDQFRMPDKKQRNLWIQLAMKLRKKGYQVTSEMCNRKFRNLKQTYRTIYYSKRSEKNKKRWEFYSDLSVLIPPLPQFQRNNSLSPPPVSPVSHSKNVKSRLSPTENQISDNSKTEFSQHLNRTQNNYSTNNKQDPPKWFKDFLIEFKASQDNVIDNIRKMHDESKQLEIRKIKLLENILSLMNKNK